MAVDVGVIVAAFRAEADDELCAEKGDRVCILHRYDDDWMLVEQESGDGKGLIPACYVEAWPDETQAAPVRRAPSPPVVASSVALGKKSGWLEVEMSTGKWKRRWYVLEERTLFVCKDPSSMQHKKPCFTLGYGGSVRILRHQTDRTAPPVLQFKSGMVTGAAGSRRSAAAAEQELYLRTTSDAEADLWKAAVEGALSRY